MKINPLFESSARRRMRMAKTPVIITAYLGTLLVVAACEMAPFLGQGVTVVRMRLGIENYIWLTALQFFLILLVAPAMGAASISGERERQTFDLLLVTGVGSCRIVLGKLLENFAFLALLILCSAPIMGTVWIMGGVGVFDVMMTLLYLMVIALGALSVGMVMSVFFHRTLAAVIVSYLAVFAIGAGTWILARYGMSAAYTWETLQELEHAAPLAAVRALPPLILFNAAVGLVMLLAGQTGILHHTMQTTMQLQEIYTISKFAGFTMVSYVVLIVILLSSVVLIGLACAVLHGQTGAARVRRSKQRNA